MQKVLLERPALKVGVPSDLARWAVPQWEDIGPEQFVRRDDLSVYSPPGVSVKGIGFFTHLMENGIIKFCLSFQEGGSLIKSGVLPKWFPGKHLCLWRSTAYDNSGNMFVPWIQNIRNQTPLIRWWWLEYELYESHITVLFDLKLLLHFSFEPVEAEPLVSVPVA